MNKMLWAFALFLLAAVAAPSGAQAQTLVKTSCAPTNPFVAGQTGRPFSIDENGNTCITGSISASLTGFTPGGTYATLTATAASASVALPAGATVAVQNTGTTTVSCTLGVGSATAVAGQIQVPASSTVFLTPGSNTFIGCIDETGSASNVVRIAGGSGLGTGFGGGGGGGGGSSSITTWGGGTLGAMANYGTSPGAVLVPGMNAFITNTPSVLQSGTWTVQPGNTANTTPWLATIAQGGNSAIVKAGNTFAASDVALGVSVVNTNANGQAAMAASSPVVIASNQTANPLWGHGATGAAVPANATYFGFNSGGNLTGASTSAPLPVRPGDGTRNAVLDPCEASTPIYAPILMTTATTLQVAAASASNKTYICSLFLKASAANNVALVEGTGGSCVTGITGVIGGTTTSNGFVFGTAGDGVLLQSGGKEAIAQTAGTNVGLCLITSTTGPLIGAIRYVQAP